MLATTLTPEICDKAIAGLPTQLHDKIVRAFIAALDEGADLIDADGNSPAGEVVMALFNANMDRDNWSTEGRRALRFYVRVIGMTLIRDTLAAV